MLYLTFIVMTGADTASVFGQKMYYKVCIFRVRLYISISAIDVDNSKMNISKYKHHKKLWQRTNQILITKHNLIY